VNLVAANDVDQIRRHGFGAFHRRAWPHIDGSKLLWNWHIDAMAEHLTALRHRKITDLVINVPPGTAKSLVCSVSFEAWVWADGDAQHRWMNLSYDNDLVLRDARKMRSLVASEWYRERWPHVQFPVDRTASTAASLFYNTVGGMRASMTLKGGVTGKHAHTAIADDPIDTTGASAASGKELDEVIQFWFETLTTRFADPEHPARLCVMQRLHERDLAGEMVRRGAHVLCLPMRFNPNHRNRWANDPRKEAGELLFPARFSEKTVTENEIRLGPRAASAQYGQDPVPPGGTVFKESQFKFWTNLPDGTDLISVDCAFKGKEDSDPVVIQVWRLVWPNFYLVDQTKGRMAFSETVAAIVAMCLRYPNATAKLVEDKANGSAVLDMLVNEIPGLLPVEPKGGKLARAHSVEPLVAAGNVFLPDPDHAVYPDGRVGARWVVDDLPGQPRSSLLGELTGFPTAPNDDQVDAFTQAIAHMHESSEGLFSAAMKKLDLNTFMRGMW
jgi:predicted phage terminase large subunit-like protein